MAHKRRMHTVPASYLDAFAFRQHRRTPAVWRYGRSQLGPDPIGINDAEVWKDIYAFENDAGQWSTEIEDVLETVERTFCKVRKAIETGTELDIDERKVVARFIAFQLLRTPRSLQLHRDELARVMKAEVVAFASDKEKFHIGPGSQYQSYEACELARKSLLAGGWHVEADAFTGLHAMMNTVSRVALWVTLMDWTVFTSDGTYLLMTSDNPVTLWKTRIGSGYPGTEVGVGFADPTLLLSFPVTPLVALVARHTLFSLTAINAEDLDAIYHRMSNWEPLLRFEPAKPSDLKRFDIATVDSGDLEPCR